jgi:Protein of unknown function (DUF1643).
MKVRSLKVKKIESIGTITTKMVTDDERKHCYEIERVLNVAEGEMGIILGLYPTLGVKEIDKYQFDSTTCHLLNHMNELGLKSVKIINLFSKISKGARMSSRNLQIDIDNIQHIENIMKQKEFSQYRVILAFGSGLSSSDACIETKRRFIKMYRHYNPGGKLYQITADGISLKNEKATHILFMGIRHANAKWKLEEFEITPDLLTIANKEDSSKKKTLEKTNGEKNQKDAKGTVNHGE